MFQHSALQALLKYFRELVTHMDSGDISLGIVKCSMHMCLSVMSMRWRRTGMHTTLVVTAIKVNNIQKPMRRRTKKHMQKAMWGTIKYKVFTVL